MAQSRICLVTFSQDECPDAMIGKVVRELKSAGIRAAGLLQEVQPGDSSSCAILFLEDIETGQRIQAFERRGAEARGCRLDPSGLARAAGWVRKAIDAKPDVLFINRFGRQESEGRGLLDETGAAIIADIPVVVAVNWAFLPKWYAFAGHESASVVASAEQLTAWCFTIAPQSAAFVNSVDRKGDVTLMANTTLYSSSKKLARREINDLGCAEADFDGQPNGYTQLM